MKKMIKTISLSALSSIALATSVLANAGPAPMLSAPMPAAPVESKCSEFFRSGFYFGGQAGYSMAFTKFQGTRSDYITGDQDLYPFSLTPKDGRFMGEIFLGGRYMMNCMMFGAELGMAVNDTKSKSRFQINPQAGSGIDIWEMSSKRTAVYKSSLVMGYAVHSKVILYTKLGVAISSFQFEEIGVDALPNQVDTVNLSKSTRVGFAPAIGAEYCFTDMLSGRFEVGGEFYKKAFKAYPVDGLATLKNNVSNNCVNAMLGVVVKM